MIVIKPAYAKLPLLIYGIHGNSVKRATCIKSINASTLTLDPSAGISMRHPEEVDPCPASQDVQKIPCTREEVIVPKAETPMTHRDAYPDKAKNCKPHVRRSHRRAAAMILGGHSW